MSDKEAMSELSSSIREGAGYGEIYPSGCKPEEDFPRSTKRELSAHCLYDDEENNEKEDKGDIEGDEYDEGDEDEENKEDEEDEGNQSEGVESVGHEDGGAHPFILLLIWTVNDFYPKITDKVFNTFQDHYQILENIPLHLPKKN